MGVGFPEVLLLSIHVGLVIVFHRRVIVLVGVRGRHVLPQTPVA
jgi:hypothetical protein